MDLMLSLAVQGIQMFLVLILAPLLLGFTRKAKARLLRRQGPPLLKIVGRPAGKVDGFHYSAGFAKADFVWDDARLDAWLANPQAMVPGTIMAYRQPKPETRAAIIVYLKELN